MYIEINNIRYHIQMRGEGQPLLCLHGFSEDLSTWDRLYIPGYRLILIDLIGHGQSDKPRRIKPYKIRTIVRHIHEIMIELGYPKHSILGYSMGGRIALKYLIEYEANIDRAILESVSYGINGVIARFKRRMRDTALALDIKRGGIDWFVNYWTSLNIFESQMKLTDEERLKIRYRRRCNVSYALSNTLLGCGQGTYFSLKENLFKVNVPILYIHGEYDLKYGIIGQEFEEINQNVETVTINEAGHNTHVERPELFNSEVRKFMKRNG